MARLRAAACAAIAILVCLAHAPSLAAGYKMNFRVENGQLWQLKGNTWVQFGYISGMNIGASKPGHDPGELPLTKDDYLRYFKYTQTLGCNVIRIYTTLPPSFYDAIVQWNTITSPNDPLYVIHGVWSPDEELSGPDGWGADAFEDDIYSKMKKFIEKTTTAAHGTGVVEYANGVFGTYTSDISQWVLGWLMGTEWEPFAVNKTNYNVFPGAPYTGRWVRCSPDSNTFENWLCIMLDYLCTLNANQGWMFPMAVSNWVTTDPLHHPLEPQPDISYEDWMTVNSKHFILSPEWAAGYWVTEHLYCYYPDFLRYSLADYGYPKSETGQSTDDPFEWYLIEYRRYFADYMLVISETGFPTSLGSAHFGYKNRDHGHVREDQQGIMLVETMDMMYAQGYQGVILFELTDEWFKRSWNTIKWDLNRKAWHNTLSSEQYFGIIAVEPRWDVDVDGDSSDWTTLEAPNIGGNLPGVKRVLITHDASFVYILAEKFAPWQPNDQLWIGVDSVPTEGSFFADVFETIRFDSQIDYLLAFGTGGVAAYSNDAMSWWLRRYAERVRLLDDASILANSARGRFHIFEIITKVPTEVPRRGFPREPYYFPHTLFTAGQLVQGTTKVTDPDFNNLAGYQVKDNVIEARVPWSFFGFSDPSLRMVYTFQGKSNLTITQQTAVGGIGLELWFNNVKLQKQIYKWDMWSQPCFCERYKVGAHNISTAMFKYRGLANPVDSFPRAQQHCECTTTSTDNLKAAQKYLILASFAVVMAALFYVGVVRPVFGKVLYCYSVRHRKRVQQGLGSLQGIAFIMLLGTSLAIFARSRQRDMTVLQVVVAFAEDVEAERATVSTIYAYFLMYMVLQNWDAFLLLCMSIIVPWRGPNDPKYKPPAAANGSGAGGAGSGNGAAGGASSSAATGGASTLRRRVSEAPVEVPQAEKGGHAFIIACHNSSKKIVATVENILKKSEPWQVFVADNGSSVAEIEATERACRDLTLRYVQQHPSYTGPPVSFGTLPEGNKTIAQFATAYNLRNFSRRIDFVTLIDDDTIVPDAWSQEEVLSYFEDPAVKCLAYPLCAMNRTYALAQFENMEYLLAGFFKIVQAHFGTTLFASGAFNTWRTEYIVDILYRHDTMHHGDDLQQGLILHSLAGRPWIMEPSKVHTGGYKVDCASTIVVGTDVPICWVHIRDILPRSVSNKLGLRPCDCGEPSLFLQRGKGWDVSRHRFLWKYVKMIFHPPSVRSWRGVWARVLALHDLFMIINDWLFFFYGIIILVMYKNYVVFLKGIILAWAFQIVVFAVYNWRVLSPIGRGIAPETRVLFPLIYKLPVLLFLRVYGMLYNILYYFPFVRNKPRVIRRVEKNEGFQVMVDNAYGRPHNSDVIGAKKKLDDGLDISTITVDLGPDGLPADPSALRDRVAVLCNEAARLQKELLYASALYMRMTGGGKGIDATQSPFAATAPQPIAHMPHDEAVGRLNARSVTRMASGANGGAQGGLALTRTGSAALNGAGAGVGVGDGLRPASRADKAPPAGEGTAATARKTTSQPVAGGAAGATGAHGNNSETPPVPPRRSAANGTAPATNGSLGVANGAPVATRTPSAASGTSAGGYSSNGRSSSSAKPPRPAIPPRPSRD